MNNYEQRASELENQKRKNISSWASNIGGSYTQQRLAREKEEREKTDLERQLKLARNEAAKEKDLGTQLRSMLTKTVEVRGLQLPRSKTG